jgi:hypothetical protein
MISSSSSQETLWGDSPPPQSETTTKQEVALDRHIKISLAELSEKNNLTQLKWCSKCREMKPLIAFGKHTKEKFGRRCYCRECHLEYQRKYDQRRSKYSRWQKALKKYGITPEEYDVMLEAQGGVCAACGNKEIRIDPRLGAVTRLVVDHDHATGKVRGLLCIGCNAAYGNLYEDPQRINGLLVYHQKIHGEDINL